MTGLDLQARAAALAARIGVSGAIIIALAIAAGVQTARLDGFHVGPIGMTGWIKTAQQRQDTIDAMIDAQALAAAAAKAARLEREATYRDIAERIDDNAQDEIEAAMAAADRFIAAGGLRAEAGRSAPCPARTAAGDHAAADSVRTGRATQLDAAGAGAADPGQAGEGRVLVSAADVRICTRNTVKAEAGRALALQLEAASQAEPAPEQNK